MGVSFAADASPGNDKRLSVNVQVDHDLAAFGIFYDCTDRDGDQNIFGTPAGPVITLSLLASLGHVMLLILQIEQCPAATHGFDNHVTALAAVSAIRASLGHKFLTPKTDAALAAAAGFDINFRFVNKFHRSLPISHESYADFTKKKRHFMQVPFDKFFARCKCLQRCELNFPYVHSRLPFVIVFDGELDTVTFLQTAEALAGNRGIMDKNIFS